MRLNSGGGVFLLGKVNGKRGREGRPASGDKSGRKEEREKGRQTERQMERKR